jgi:hypothetical protein
VTSDEVARYEHKQQHNPNDPKHRLQLVKEAVAMANAEGGVIAIGVANDGFRVGVDDACVAALDPELLCDLVDRFIAGDHIELSVRTSPAEQSELRVVEISVPRHPRPPLVFSKGGNYASASGHQEVAFRRGDVYIRKGTKAEVASRNDYLGWISNAVDRERELWRSRVTLIAELPPEAELSFATGSDIPQDEPAAILSRAIPIWKRDPSKLLSGQELATLLLVRESLNPSSDGQALILHSALRRRSTLWHWLGDFMPSVDRVKSLLLDAVGGSDRDKSDAGRSIVEVAAALLGPADYGQVIGALSSSSYTHFREAAHEGADQSHVRSDLKQLRKRLLNGVSLVDASDAELHAVTREHAGVLTTPGRHVADSRELNRVGLEFFARSPLGQVALGYSRK